MPQAVPKASAQPEQPPEQPQRPRPVDLVLPSAPSQFPGLNALSKEEMSALRAEQKFLDDWLTDQREVKEYKDKAQQLRQEQEGMAYNVLAMESEFDSTHRAYENSTQGLSSAQSRVQALLDERQNILQRQSPDELGRILKTRAQNADSDAEQCLQTALVTPSELDLAQFRQTYLSKKTEMHKRVALSERLRNATGAPGA